MSKTESSQSQGEPSKLAKQDQTGQTDLSLSSSKRITWNDIYGDATLKDEEHINESDRNQTDFDPRESYPQYFDAEGNYIGPKDRFGGVPVKFQIGRQTNFDPNEHAELKKQLEWLRKPANAETSRPAASDFAGLGAGCSHLGARPADLSAPLTESADALEADLETSPTATEAGGEKQD